MKTIRIVTPQNILIEHELGTATLRIVAFVIDQIVLIIFLLFFYLVLAGFGANTLLGLFSTYLILVPIYLGYTLFFEWLNHGQTLGKMLTGLRVRKLDGSEIGFTEAATRWLLRIIDVYATVGSLAALLISSTERAQRLGDVLAGTMVIKQVTGKGLAVQNLLKITSTETYQPKYPEAVKLREEDVVLIKQTLLRAKKYNNGAHREAILLLRQKIATLLQITPKEPSPELFLRTVLKDYIVLTR